MSPSVTGVSSVAVLPFGGGGAAANPWWDPDNEGLCVWGAWQARNVADFPTSLMDLSGNGNNLIDPGGAATPGWNAAQGWIFNALTMYLNTPNVPINGPNWSIFGQFTNSAGDLRTIIGSLNVLAQSLHIVARAAAARYCNGGVINVAPNMASGNFAVAGLQGYRNGIPDGAPMPGTAAYNIPMAIGALQNVGVQQWFFDAQIQACAVYSCTLTANQTLSVAMAMAAI